MLKLAILDDYLHMAKKVADWSELEKRVEMTVFDRNLKVPDEAAEVLAPYHIQCHLRERMPVPRALFDKLPNLRYVAATGVKHRTLDYDAATERGIPVSHSGQYSAESGFGSTAELAIGMMISLSRMIPRFDADMRKGAWQNQVGSSLAGRRVGLVGLGNIGKNVARACQMFDAEVVAWSPNLTEERLAGTGVKLASKDELFATADIISFHIVLGESTRGLITAHELGLMKPTAYIVNTSRGPLIEEKALMDVLSNHKIAGAGIDTYWDEPLSPDHPIRKLDNVLITPHVGYVTTQGLAGFYKATIENVMAFLDGKPIRVLNPEAGAGNPRE